MVTKRVGDDRNNSILTIWMHEDYTCIILYHIRYWQWTPIYVNVCEYGWCDEVKKARKKKTRNVQKNVRNLPWDCGNRTIYGQWNFDDISTLQMRCKFSILLNNLPFAADVISFRSFTFDNSISVTLLMRDTHIHTNTMKVSMMMSALTVASRTIILMTIFMWKIRWADMFHPSLLSFLNIATKSMSSYFYIQTSWKMIFVLFFVKRKICSHINVWFVTCQSLDVMRNRCRLTLRHRSKEKKAKERKRRERERECEKNKLEQQEIQSMQIIKMWQYIGMCQKNANSIPLNPKSKPHTKCEGKPQ